MASPDIRAIVETCLRNHPKDCVFLPNAVDNIVAQVSAADKSIMMDELNRAFEKNEVYCPHEGIDRRHEFPELFKIEGNV